MKQGLKSKVFFALIAVWAAFSFALLSWWVVFSLKQLNKIYALNLSTNTELLKHQKMLLYEGLSLFFCLILGAGLLFYFLIRENKMLRQRKDFLSSFTHDLKTTIASLRLRLERFSNINDLEKFKTEAVEVQKIGTRLNQQLQNALQLSYQDSDLVIEKVSINKEIDYIKNLWPSLMIKVEEQIDVYADAFLFRNILSNLIQNAQDHAQAKTLIVSQKKHDEFSEVRFYSPDAKAFNGKIEELVNQQGQRKSIDSSGLGLKISTQIMKSFSGKLNFEIAKNKSLVPVLVFPSFINGVRS